MSTHHSSTLHAFASRIPQSLLEIDEQHRDAAAEDQDKTSVADAGSGGLLAEHGGKLAIGAAAMLGLAVFYRWWENRLAREDPGEYERLRRLKSAIEHADAPPRDDRPT